MSEIIDRLDRIENLLVEFLSSPMPEPKRDIETELAMLRARGIDPVVHFKALSRKDNRERRLKKKAKRSAEG